ncbi:MAG TPA: MBL fold metallo-hydrolase RNA specificity domain-containing protein [Candidatus Limnocylindrales bacterium]|nr:MBL fold metallo-hydrolase RNA specificity domain-containing protein [Candidatus Limnocylindrales bacterium]
MEIHFLGGATTVTGSQFLLETDRARVLIDCGMFQGSPNESIRNRIPFAFDPTTLDAVLLTHAHLDHCGLLPLLVKDGFRGPIHATSATIELATLVLLDSGRLHEEFAKREARWERRHPDEVDADDRREAEVYRNALELAASGEVPSTDSAPQAQEAGLVDAAASIAAEGSDADEVAGGPGGHRGPDGDHVPTTVEPVAPASPGRAWPRDPEAELRAQPPHLQVDLDAPLYTAKDAERSLAGFRPVRYGREVEVAPGIHATYLDAGHILGSAIIRLRIVDGDVERVIVCSGDLGRPGTPILRDPTVVTGADYVLVESTYGGREHEPSDEAIRILAETIRMVADANGVLLVPSFAIGRTQEVVWQLDRLIERGEIPELPLYLDSPMASKASDIYRRHPEYYDAETAGLLREGASPLDYPNQTVTNELSASKAIARAPRPYLIVASNGMLTGGRVVSHLRNLIDDPSATILFVGYQGEGTLGAHLQAGAREVRLDGQTRSVRCQVRSISGFSAHADEHELLAWLARFADGRRPGDPGYPRRVFLVHGDPEAQIALEPKVRELGFATHVPHWHERVTLD